MRIFSHLMGLLLTGLCFGLVAPALAQGGVDVPLGGTEEPTIVVNPCDPNNVAVAWKGDLRVSTDGGVNWTAATPSPGPPGQPAGGSIDPTLAFTWDSVAGQSRLIWVYRARWSCPPPTPGFSCWNIWAVEINPTTGAVIDDPAFIEPYLVSTPATPGDNDDKPWLAADAHSDSALAGKLYVCWAKFVPNSDPLPVNVPIIAHVSSTNFGRTWTSPQLLSPQPGQPGWFNQEGWTLFSHIAVGPPYDHGGGQPSNFFGDVYIAYQSQTGWIGVPASLTNPDGTSGRVMFLHSNNGGTSWSKTTAYGAGQADITWNYQSSPSQTVPNTRFVTGGSSQPWVVPDPHTPGIVHVFAADDPNNSHGDLEDSRIYRATSANHGQTWTAPQAIEPSAPSGSFQFFPTAAVDPRTGCLVVSWFDNRNAGTDSLCNYHRLHCYRSISIDAGLTWSAPLQISDNPTNPQFNTNCSENSQRMGEYFGTAIHSGKSYFIWPGDDPVEPHFQTFFDSVDCACGTCLADMNGSGAVDGVDLGILLNQWMMSPCGPPDLNSDGIVDGIDLGILLLAFGPCCEESQLGLLLGSDLQLTDMSTSLVDVFTFAMYMWTSSDPDGDANNNGTLDVQELLDMLENMS